MITFKQFIENKEELILPPEMGTTPIPEGHIRLYHQTSPENIPSIKKHGILASKASMAEGPRTPVIWASKKPYYPKSRDIATIEFHVPEEQFGPNYLRTNHVPPEQFIGIHERWQELAKGLIQDNPEPLKQTTLDSLMTIDDDHSKATQYYTQYMKELGKL